MASSPAKVRRKGDGTTEIRTTCPLCGSNSMEINHDKGLFSCWSCRYSGKLSSVKTETVKAKKAKPQEVEFSTEFPPFAEEAVSRRGFDLAFLRDVYGVRWDGHRLCFPTGPGTWARRAALSFEQPKVLTTGEKGLIGFHRLGQGQHLVLTEGDYKAASIPGPWIGLGIQGTGPLTARQAGMLQAARPARVLICLDGSWESEALTIKSQLWWAESDIIELPEGKGPDDVERSVLIPLLLGDK